MKITSPLAVLFASTLAVGAFAADESPAKDGCMMKKKEPAPEPPACCKMMSKADAPAKATDLNALVDQMKAAKGDQALDAFAAVLNEILAERKAAQDKAPEASAPAALPAHQH